MARGRNRAAYFGGTKGHSILPQRNYGLYSRSKYFNEEDYPVPGTYRPSTSFYPGSDYYIADAMSTHATNLSTDTVYDNMDLAARSRGKDQRLMTQVNAALAYATPSTPARARASARAHRQQEKAPVSTTSSCSSAYSVPYQVPYLAVCAEPESRNSRARSLSPVYLYRRPVAGRARARTTRRGSSLAPDGFEPQPVRRGRAPIRASPVRYLPWSVSPTREAELALSPTRLDDSRSRDVDDPYVRGFSFAYPYRTALWARRGGLPLRRSKYWDYPYVGSNLSGYPFGNTNWIIPPSKASELGVTPVRSGREGVDPITSSRWFWGPSMLDYDVPPARYRYADGYSLYDPRFDITPAEAIRFGIAPTTAANWNAASPIRTGRWDMAPAEGMTWESPEEPLNWNVYPLRAGSPRSRSLSPMRSQSQALSGDEARRWGITPSEAAIWGMYPSSRKVALERYERARSLSPLRFERARSVSPFRYARARSLSPYRYARARSLSPSRYDPDLLAGSWMRSYSRCSSLSPSCRYGVDPPYSVPRWVYPSMRPREVAPVRFSPLPMRTRRNYATPRLAKKAIIPTKAARRAAARRLAYVPWAPVQRAPVVVVYMSDKDATTGRRGRSLSADARPARLSAGAVSQILKRFEPRKPYEDEYSGKVAAARAIARAITVIPQGPDFQAAIISPSVEIETKKKKGPKSKYAAAVMRELRLNPKKSEGGGSGSGSGSGGGGGQPSALRQRLRKVLCKSHNDPTYYRD